MKAGTAKKQCRRNERTSLRSGVFSLNDVKRKY
jgi:hypothetical protein